MNDINDAKNARLDKRELRRREIRAITARLGEVMSAEERYRDRIPENLQGGDRYDDACEAIDAMGEAISLLEKHNGDIVFCVNTTQRTEASSQRGYDSLKQFFH